MTPEVLAHNAACFDRIVQEWIILFLIACAANLLIVIVLRAVRKRTSDVPMRRPPTHWELGLSGAWLVMMALVMGLHALIGYELCRIE